MSELAPPGTPVGTVLAAAVNQTIFYSIVAGNDLGRWEKPPHSQSSLGETPATELVQVLQHVADVADLLSVAPRLD